MAPAGTTGMALAGIGMALALGPPPTTLTAILLAMALTSSRVLTKRPTGAATGCIQNGVSVSRSCSSSEKLMFVSAMCCRNEFESPNTGAAGGVPAAAISVSGCGWWRDVLAGAGSAARGVEGASDDAFDIGTQTEAERGREANDSGIDRDGGSPFAEERTGRCCATLRAGVGFAAVSAAEVSGLVVDSAGLALAL